MCQNLRHMPAFHIYSEDYCNHRIPQGDYRHPTMPYSYHKYYQKQDILQYNHLQIYRSVQPLSVDDMKEMVRLTSRRFQDYHNNYKIHNNLCNSNICQASPLLYHNFVPPFFVSLQILCHLQSYKRQAPEKQPAI